MKYAYYPGCSLEVNSAAYDVSVREVAELLGIELVEIDDWNCCGATEYFSQDELTACAVIARTWPWSTRASTSWSPPARPAS